MTLTYNSSLHQFETIAEQDEEYLEIEAAMKHRPPASFA